MGIIDYHSPLNVLISVNGHPYERDPFAAVFESLEGIRHTFVEQPASQAFSNPDAAEPWDVLVFYDMPGIDSCTVRPWGRTPSVIYWYTIPGCASAHGLRKKKHRGTQWRCA